MKVRCFDVKYQKNGEGYNCAHFDQAKKVCLAKSMGGAKHPTVFPSKSRACSCYKEAGQK